MPINYYLLSVYNASLAPIGFTLNVTGNLSNGYRFSLTIHSTLQSICKNLLIVGFSELSPVLTNYLDLLELLENDLLEYTSLTSGCTESERLELYQNIENTSRAKLALTRSTINLLVDYFRENLINRKTLKIC